MKTIKKKTNSLKVGGWLFFFCMVLWIYQGSFVYYIFDVVLDKLLKLPKHYPGRLTFLWFSIFMTVGLIAFTSVVLYRLLNKKIHSVSLTKIYLVLFLICTIIWILLIPNMQFEDAFSVLLPASAFVVIWYVYFLKSVRVKKTFPAEFKG